MIPLGELQAAWDTMTKIMDNYETGGPGWSDAAKGRRLIEVEMANQWQAQPDSEEVR